MFNKCFQNFKQTFHVDGILVLFKKPVQVKLFVHYIQRKLKKKFSFETEKDLKMTLLVNANVCRENGKFVTNVYRKESFTRFHTKLSSFIPLVYKFGITYTLVHRRFCLATDTSKFHFEIEKNRTLNSFIF